MKYDDKIFDYILNNPDVYYKYYNEKYKITLDILNILENRDAPLTSLIPIRASLSEYAGKKAVILGITKLVPKDTLFKYWKICEDGKLEAIKGFKKIEEYEQNISYIQHKCLTYERENS